MAITLTIDIPEELAQRLDDYPVVVRARKVEQAINAALDAAGFPGEKKPIELKVYYVNLWTSAGNLKGHVGPISDRVEAQRVMLSWQRANHIAKISDRFVGPCLTAKFELADVYS